LYVRLYSSVQNDFIYQLGATGAAKPPYKKCLSPKIMRLLLLLTQIPSFECRGVNHDVVRRTCHIARDVRARLWTAAKIASPAQAVVARKQRRPCVEPGGIAASDAVAARVAAIVMAARVSACVRRIVAIVVIVVPRRGGGGDCGREQFVPRPPVLSTRHGSGRRSIGPRLGALYL